VRTASLNVTLTVVAFCTTTDVTVGTPALAAPATVRTAKRATAVVNTPPDPAPLMAV
jgi:hypothetical protein